MKRGIALFCLLPLGLLLLGLDARAEGPGPPAPNPSPSASPTEPYDGPQQLGWIPGQGFELAKGPIGSLNLNAYVLLRYINQLPAEQTFVDHLGRTRQVNARNDIQLHRVMIHFKGFLFTPRFTQQTSVWAVNSTNSVTAFAALNYEFNKGFILSGGIGALPGTRSMNYEHPYFLGTDRQMADEFFRPSFTGGIWVGGDPVPELMYRLMVGNNLNQVDIRASQLSRDMALAGTLAWMPTTGEFGPKGGFGDFEYHQRVATRFGVSAVHSREDRQDELNTNFPDNTTIKLSDSVLLFETGSLANGVTIQKADFNLLALDASAKYHGLFLFSEYYCRWLKNMLADGPLPIETVVDQGLMLQASYMVTPERIEVYGAHSQLYGQFNRAFEITGGINYYPFRTRSLKVNAVVSYVDRSPVSSYFGYFTGGQKGPIISLSTDYFF